MRIRCGRACNIPSPDDRRWCDNLDRWHHSVRTQNRDRGHEAVSAPRNGFHIARCLGVIVECVPHFSDGHAQAVIELNEGVFRPQTLPDFFASDDLSGSLHQHHEQSVGKVLDFHAGAIPRKRLLSGVQFERTEAVTSPVWHYVPACTSPKLEDGSTASDNQIPVKVSP